MNDANQPGVAAFKAVWRSSALMRRAADRLLAEQGKITSVQFEILRQLRSVPEGLRMHELADRLVHSRSGLTYQIGQLEKLGFVTRISDEDNERAVTAVLTQRGIDVCDELRRTFQEIMKKHFVDVISEAELELIVEVHERVIASFELSDEAVAQQPQCAKHRPD